MTAAPVTVPEGQTEATVVLTAAANAAVGTHNIVVVGTMTVSNHRISLPIPAPALTVIGKR